MHFLGVSVYSEKDGGNTDSALSLTPMAYQSTQI